MQKPNEIREHIATVLQTQKITHAMEMISSNRMKQVMHHIEYNRLYFTYIRRTMKEILSSSQDIIHPFLVERESKHRTFVVISGDKGFCGAYNTTVLNYGLKRVKENPGCSLIVMGHTAEAFFHSHKIVPNDCFHGIVQDPTLDSAREVANALTDLYENEQTDEITMIYTSFYGETKHQPVESHLYPLLLPDYDDIRDAEEMDDIMYHPSAQIVFNMMMPQYAVGIVFGVMVQAYASEHYARMTAMRSATTNAKDMVDGLRTQYNLARQSAITNELSEIADAAEILKSADFTMWGENYDEF
ncbi:MAG: ATP synthase F1 subunit gamma [Oscillospiraceae bacterium]|jgi:F-type H+-transporting ATPase subunit gamma|nr:ATP synthase F1 subunit gamma [Oscillospiraceae bacterium]